MKAARRILFVDDDELILRSMERVLRRPAAESGWELCELPRRRRRCCPAIRPT